MNLNNKSSKTENRIFIIKDNHWFFIHNDQKYIMAPAGIISLTMSPVIKGANELLEINLNKGLIKNPDKGFFIKFSNEESLDYDIKFVLDQSYKNGWVYNIEYRKPVFNEIIKVWACDYLKLFYKNAPDVVYVTVE